MIRGGGRTSAAPTLAHQQPSLDRPQAEWVQHGTVVSLTCLLTADNRQGEETTIVKTFVLPLVKISTFLPDSYAVFSSITSWQLSA